MGGGVMPHNVQCRGASRNGRRFPRHFGALILISLLLISLCACRKRQLTTVLDVTKPDTLNLTTAPKQGISVYSLSLRIHGELDGVADISGTILSTQRIAGHFDIRRGGDYYMTNCVIQYSPGQVRSGTVSVEYEFRTTD